MPISASIKSILQDVILSFRAMGLCKFYICFVESILLKSILIANNARGWCVLVLRALRKPIVILQQYVSIGSSGARASFVYFSHIYSNYLLLLTSPSVFPVAPSTG